MRSDLQLVHRGQHSENREARAAREQIRFINSGSQAPASEVLDDVAGRFLVGIEIISERCPDDPDVQDVLAHFTSYVGLLRAGIHLD